MANWYTGRDALKRVALINGADRNGAVDRAIEAASRLIDRRTRRVYIPQTETRLYRWPPRQPSLATVLWVDQDLLAVTTLQTQAQDSSPTTIASGDYFLEPNNDPPYNRIEIDESSTAAFEGGDTSQRSISVAGRWGYSENTRSAGTVASGLASDATAASMVCSDASLVDVGDTLLIESEQLFISDRSFAALGSILLNGALTADKSETTVTVDGSHGILAGETIQVESERMYVEGVSGNDLTVSRAYDGTVLAAHADDTAVQINRTLTVERGVNGTTAATHADATAISVYEPPFDIRQWCEAEALAALAQGQAAWGRSIGTGEGASELSGRSLARLRDEMTAFYRRYRSAVI